MFLTKRNASDIWQKTVISLDTFKPQPVRLAARSKARVCGRSPAGIVGSITLGAWRFVVSVVCCLVEVCFGLITCPEESYRLWCVQWVWSRSTLRWEHGPESGWICTEGKNWPLVCIILMYMKWLNTSFSSHAARCQRNPSSKFQFKLAVGLVATNSV
jgi:hypothetical protein